MLNADDTGNKRSKSISACCGSREMGSFKQFNFISRLINSHLQMVILLDNFVAFGVNRKKRHLICHIKMYTAHIMYRQ